MRARIRALVPLAALALSACGGMIPQGTDTLPPPSRPSTRPYPPAPPRPAPPTSLPAPATPSATPVVPGANAVGAGVTPGPAIGDLLPRDERTATALAAFRLSCPSLLRRTDASGLSQPADWQPACSAALNWPDRDAANFFARYFEAVRVGDGAAFATGYYEPEIAASRVRMAGYEVPIYRRPPDLVDVDLGLFSDELKGKKIRGRVDGQSFVPYADRAQIVDQGALSGRGLELAWAADPYEFFFLQIQGSGRLRLPDGSVMRIGYDSQNGRDYTGIGKLMKDRGLIQNGSMQDIVGWLRANPAQAGAIMNENKSFVFFRELTGAGAIGALGVPVSPRASVAADPRYVPLGAPVLLMMDRDEATGLWVAQDTGGAIKGANRFDTFWGAGDDAARIAGGMSARGTTFVLLPQGGYQRLASRYGWTTPAP